MTITVKPRYNALQGVKRFYQVAQIRFVMVFLMDSNREFYALQHRKKIFPQLHPSPCKMPKKTQVGIKTHICQSVAALGYVAPPCNK